MIAMQARYRLPDEPLPGSLSKYAVDPIWPLLAVMLSGNLIGLAWFVFNSFALGSAGRRHEITWAALSLAGCMGLFALMEYLQSVGLLVGSEIRYAALSLTVLKLVAGYKICLSQQRSFELWKYFGGQPANALPMLVVAYLLSRSLARLGDIPDLIAVAIR